MVPCYLEPQQASRVALARAIISRRYLFSAQKFVKKRHVGTYLFLHLIDHGLNGNLHISKLSFSIHSFLCIFSF